MARASVLTLLILAALVAVWSLRGDDGATPVTSATPAPTPTGGPAGVTVPAGMVYVEGSDAWIGTDAADLDALLAGRDPDIRKLFRYESPRHAHPLRPYCIGLHEVTNAQYLRFLQARTAGEDRAQDHPAASGEADHPVRLVTYDDAERFAEWAGLRLPTEFEWEWAARGPGGPRFPWGGAWPSDASRANWGGKVVDERYEPTTLPVGALPVGRSWCGLHHMVGNVAEWTSSWFEAYPGNEATSPFMGRWVKVIRGGSAADGEMVVLRPACRNFVGGGPDAPPYPENAFPRCGFRLAHTPIPGADRLGPILRRATRARRIEEEHLDLDRFVAADTHAWVEADATPPDHVTVLGRSHALVLVPVRSFLRPQGYEDMRNAFKKPGRFLTAEGLARASEGEKPFWTVGVLHTDLPLESVEVPAGAPGPHGPPPTARGRVAPGTYSLAIWHGRLALLAPDLAFVGFLPLSKGQARHFEVETIEPSELRGPVLEPDPDLDWADFAFDLPLGGRGVDPGVRLVIRGRLLFEVGSLEAAGRWR